MSARDVRELADEYVLGLLEEPERSAFELAAERDPTAQAALAASQERFLELDLAAAEAEFSEDALWGRIEAAVAKADTERGAPEASAGEGGGADGGPVGVAAQNDNGIRPWRLATFASLVASLILAVALSWSLLSVEPPRVVAVLLDDGGEPVALIEDFGDASARLVMLADVTVPQDRSLQVWTKPSDDIGPVSMGVIEAAMTTRLGGWRLPAPREAQLYEITLERAGGSPTGLPTGPIIGKGFAKAPR